MEPTSGQVDLDSLLKVHEVQVVQSLDAGALKWILSKLREADEDKGERLAALERTNEALQGQLQQLQEQQDGLEKQNKDSNPFLGMSQGEGGEDKEAGLQAFKDLPKRVKALELALKLGAGAPGHPAGSEGGEDNKPMRPSRAGSPEQAAAAGRGDGTGEAGGGDGAAAGPEGGGSEQQGGDGGGDMSPEERATAAEKEQQGAAGSVGAKGTGAGKAAPVAPGGPVDLSGLQQRVEELEYRLREAEKALPEAKRAADEAAARAQQAADAAQQQGGSPTILSSTAADPTTSGAAGGPAATHSAQQQGGPGAHAGAPAAGGAGAQGGAGRDGGDGAMGAAGAAGSAGAMGGQGVGGREGEVGVVGLQGVAGPAGKDGAEGRAGATRVLHLRGDGGVDPLQLIRVVNEGAADVERLRLLVLELRDKQQQLALAGLQSLPRPSGDDGGQGLLEAEGDRAALPGDGYNQGEAGAEEPSGTSAEGGGDGAERGEGEAGDGSPASPGGLLDPKRRGKGSHSDAAKTVEALNGVGSLEQLLPFIKDLYVTLGNKADRMPFEDLLRRVSQLAIIMNVDRERRSTLNNPHAGKGARPSYAGGPRDGQAEGATPTAAADGTQGTADNNAGDGTQAYTDSPPPSPSEDMQKMGSRLKALMDKVGDLAFTVMQLQGAEAARRGAGGEDEGRRHEAEDEAAAARAAADAELEKRLEQLELGMGGKADQAAVDALKLQLALLGGRPQPPIVQRDFQYMSSMERREAEAGAQGRGATAESGTDGQGGEGGENAGGGQGDGAGGGSAEARAAARASGGGGAGGMGSGQGGGAEGLLPMLEGMLADKASKAELAALHTALGQRPDYKLDVRNAVTEAKRASEAAAVARADTASQAEELAQMQRALSNLAKREELGALAQQVGDMLNDLMDLRSQVMRLPSSNEPFRVSMLGQAGEQQQIEQPQKPGQQQAKPAGVNMGGSARMGGDAEGMLRMLNVLAKELEAMKSNMDMLAHATNIMAVGREVVVVQPNSQAGSLSPRANTASSPEANRASFASPPEVNRTVFQSPGAAAAAAAAEAAGNGAAAGAGAGAGAGGLAAGPPTSLVNGKEPCNHRGAMSRLIKMLGGQGLQHKMDWFDPDVLNRIAQRMGTVDAFLKSPQLQASKVAASAAPADTRDMEGQMRRLAKEIRQIKESQAAPPVFTGGFKDNTSGDYAMLAGKPILGYRCMACDRPLDKLDDRPGPYIPTSQMPAKTPTALTQGGGARLAPLREGREGNSMSPEPSMQKVPGVGKKTGSTDPDKRGPQNWYNESHEAAGRAAESLPSQDVGPKLPPGGWRGNSPYHAPKTTLPDIGPPSRRTTSPTRGSPPTTAHGPAPPLVTPTIVPQQMQQQKPESSPETREGSTEPPADHVQLQAGLLPVI